MSLDFNEDVVVGGLKQSLVVSGDLVCEISPGAVAAAHSRHDAVVTAMLCSVPVSGPSDSGSSGAKDKAKKTGRYNIIGLDPTKQFLLHITAAVMRSDGFETLKENFSALQSELLKTVAGYDEDCGGGGKSRSVWAQLSDGGDTSGRRVRQRS